VSVIKFEEIKAGAVQRDDAILTIEVGEKELPIGGHTFELQVTDDSGNPSAPQQVMVIVADTEAPTAVVTVLDEKGLPVTANNPVRYARNFTLDASRSFDLGGGRIVSYRWRLLD